MTDLGRMRRALFHAERALGATTPNPVVGAVVVDCDGVVVGDGHHARAGAPHAEVSALQAAGARAAGGTMYVTLEPCCHTGRTGPCTTKILESGLRRVVVAALDPDPRVSGRGVGLLREAGVQVDVGLAEAEARRVNAGFFSAHERGRPLVVVKAAVSRDGRIAAAPGSATAISGAEALERVHALRAATDALAVGIGTILADDPRLTVRGVVRSRPYVRAVFDRRLRLPLTARVLSTLDEGPVVVFAAPGSLSRHAAAARALTDRGVAVTEAADLESACRALLPWDVHTLLVEGGAVLHRAFLAADLVDRLHLVVSPRALGPAGVPLFDGHAIPWTRMTGLRAEPCGLDVWMEADVHRHR